MLQEIYGITFKSSSRAAAEIFIYRQMRTWGFDYEHVEECFNDRHNHRDLWKQLITMYNTPDKARLCRAILETNDCYVGMRCELEYQASKELFDQVLWVDALKRHPTDPTMSIRRDPGMTVIDNNGDLDHLRRQLQGLFPHE